MVRERRFAFVLKALLPIAAAAFAVFFSAADARAIGLGGCDDAAEVAVLTAPLSPWRGAPLRVIVAVEKPTDGELSLIGPDGAVAAASRARLDGPPYVWFAEVASPAAGTWRAQLTRSGGLLSGCGTVTPRDRGRRDEAGAAGADAGEPVAVAQQLEPRDGESLFRVDRKTVRRAARRRAVVAGALSRCCATARATCCSIIWAAAKTKCRRSLQPRLRRPGVFPARLFRLQDGTAVRLFEMLARRRRQPAEVLRLVRALQIPGRRRAGSARRSDVICASSPTPCSPAPCACPRPTTTPISTPCR